VPAGRVRPAGITLELVRLGRERCWQNLDRDVAAESGVVRPVDLSHSAAAEERLEFEHADAPACERGAFFAGVGVGD
jgi:hypothetical protein